MHQIVHYPRCVDLFGTLAGCWMFGDERRNKLIKNMSKQRKHCEASIARVYAERVKGEAQIVCPRPISLDTACVHTSKSSKPYADTDRMLSAQLRVVSRLRFNTEVDLSLWMVHRRAIICGIGFTAGESIHGVKRAREKMLRCGSVITLVSGGRSLYARVIRFLSYGGIHVAHVEWLPIPDYPTGTPVVVRLRNVGVKPDKPCLVDLTDIDPSPITVLHEDTCMYMMRMKGLDTMPVM